MVKQKISFKSQDKVELVGILETPAKRTEKIIILCHGITSNKDEDGIFSKLAREVIKVGIACFRFDFRGHGESGGRQEKMTIKGEIKDLAAAIKVIENLGYKKISLLGASFGAGITSIYTGLNPKKIKALVLWNPLIDYQSVLNPTLPWPKKYFNQKALNEAKVNGFLYLDSKRFKLGYPVILEMKKIKPFFYFKKILCSTLILHGDKDSYVPYQDSIKYVSLLKRGKLVIIPQAEHGFNNQPWEEKRAIEETRNFLIKAT